MQGWSIPAGRAHVIRIDPGEDVLASCRKYCAEHGVRSAAVVCGYGTLAAWSLHWVTHNRIPTANQYAQGEGGIEILAMSGLVVGGEPHLHISLATRDAGFGGHVEEGTVAYVLCEIVLLELDAALSRPEIQVDIAGMGSGTITRLEMDPAEADD